MEAPSTKELGDVVNEAVELGTPTTAAAPETTTEADPLVPPAPEPAMDAGTVHGDRGCGGAGARRCWR